MSSGADRHPAFGRVRLDRDRIVDAAGEIADAQGPDALTTARLAERLCVKPSSIYRHFETIDLVKDALAARGLAELIDLIKAWARARTGREALQALAHGQRTYAQAHPGRYLAMARWGQGRSCPAGALRQSLLRLVAAQLAGYQLTGEDALEVSRCLLAALQGAVVMELTGAVGTPFEADQCYQRLLDMLDAGARSAARSAANRRRASPSEIRLRPPEALAPTAGL
jgi:AcrR family transcriptional regulator